MRRIISGLIHRRLVNALPTAAVGADLDLIQIEPLDVAVGHEESAAGWFHPLTGGMVGCRDGSTFRIGLGPAGHPQFAAREHFIEVPHTSEGAMVIENTRCKLSRTPGAPSHAGPELGEHNVYVLQEILGYDDEQLANAFASLAME